MIKINLENAKPDFTCSDKWGYEYKVKVMGKKFYFIEFYPDDDLTELEAYLVTPKEMIEIFEDGNELDREILAELMEIIKNISMKIARTRNA